MAVVGRACGSSNLPCPVELAARSLFAKDKACPLDRVTAMAHAPALPVAPRNSEQMPAPQLKIMADIKFMTAEGCGATAVYACMARGGPGEVPYCVAPGPAPAALAPGASPPAAPP
jgi:hypothetical protein